MRPRVLNYLRHQIESRQALAMLLDCLEESKRLPVLLVAPRGESLSIALRIRVSLSKERGKLAKSDRVSFGFTLSEPFPYTEGSKRCEAIAIRWRLTPSQNFKNMTDIFMHGVTYAH